MIFLRQALTASAYEAARVAIRDGKGTAEATIRAREILAARGITGAQIEFAPSNVEQLKRGSPLQVTINARADANSVGIIRFSKSRTIYAAVSMVKE